MDDIEILEQLCNNFRFGQRQILTDGDYIEFIDIEHIQAIENLIKENKELKEKLEEKDMQHELELIGKEEYTKDAMGEIIEHYYTANEDCIPKSKVKENIEEINEILDRNLLVDKLRNYFTAKKEALQELLEEGDDK